MNVPCHAIEKRVKIGNKASSQVLPTDFNTSSSTWVGEPDYKASHRFTFYQLTVSNVVEQIGAFHNLMVVKLGDVEPLPTNQSTTNCKSLQMRCVRKKATRAGLLSQ